MWRQVPFAAAFSFDPRPDPQSHQHTTGSIGERTFRQCRTGIRHTLQPLHYRARQV